MPSLVAVNADSSAPEGHTYALQKHAARRLHYDLRLELDGVLLSWAVPKGPSRSPRSRRLAVRTPDHDLEHATFEGVIAPSEHHAGSVVLLWDRGTWTPQRDPREGLQNGRLVFQLNGERLRGIWHLVRTRGYGSAKVENWLLMKSKDAEAQWDDKEMVDTVLTSIATGRTLEEIAAASADPRREPS